MGNITEIIELQAKIDRKDAYIDQLELQLSEARKELSERGELSARLYSENQTLRTQLNQKQLEVDHCRTSCDELRQKVTAAAANALDAEADLIMTAPSAGENWTEAEDKLARRIGSMMKARAALLRAGGAS